ncbi:hypothetical protein HU675_0050910 (plasmid) [Bradyrhizobium septentrionale]|uniref:hypothetical protein n=1 Tax=Bradyrhizobium septentrionale TaxID=1404411 RepID=UPI0015967758|nr:hypothetical protein [Bradyrhizobium septentrionale]UGY30406.1 hypothetical protein HU675_0050910 [Bradyrhizobium septentrionale]
MFGVFAPDQLRKQRLVDGGAHAEDVKKVIERDLGEAGTFGQMTRKVFGLPRLLARQLFDSLTKSET